MSAPHDMGPPKRRTKPPLVRPQRVADLVEIKKIVVFRGLIEDGFKPRPRLRAPRVRFAKYYVSFRGGNGRKLATSQGYSDARSAWNLAVGTLKSINWPVPPALGGKATIATGVGVKEIPASYRTMVKAYS